MAVAGRQAPGSSLMNMFQRPELYQWLGGLGAGMSRAARGQGFDISGANQQLFGAMQDRKMGTELDEMMGQLPEGTFSPAQMKFLGTLPVGMRQKVMAGSLFPKDGGERRVLKGAGGFQRYVDSGDRVFPNAEKAPGTPDKRRIIKGADDRQYYTDTKELVLPDLETPPAGPDIEKEGIFRREFNSLTKNFRIVDASYRRILASAENPSAAGDLALIFNYMKVLDPGSTVREGEFATAEQSTGVPDRVRNLYNKIISGMRLGDDQRKDFVDRAGKLYQRANSLFEGRVDQYRKISESYGFDPDRTVIGLPLEPIAEMSDKELMRLLGMD